MKKYNVSGGVDLTYQSSLVFKFFRNFERKSKRKNKIKKIFNL
jgi:hypothetical protein